MRRLRWSNVPIPEGHVVALVVGLALHLWRPLDLPASPWLRHVIGWPLVLCGILLATWAVMTVNDVEMGRPTRLVASGPYRYSRHPMYVAWSALYVGIALLVNTWWLLGLWPPLAIFTHYAVVRREERWLERQFGEAYRQYRERVRRYV